MAEDEESAGLGHGNGLLLQLDVRKRPRSRTHGHLWLVIIIVPLMRGSKTVDGERGEAEHLWAFSSIIICPCRLDPTVDLMFVPRLSDVRTSASCITYVIVGRIRVLLFALVSAVLIHVYLQGEGVTLT